MLEFPLESVSLFIFLEGIFNLFCSFVCCLQQHVGYHKIWHPVIEVQVLGPPWSQVWLAG